MVNDFYTINSSARETLCGHIIFHIADENQQLSVGTLPIWNTTQVSL